MIKPESVDRHVAYIMEVRPVATRRDLARHVATGEADETIGKSRSGEAETTDDKARQTATTPELSQPVAADARYVAVLERENDFLREQIAVKDEQIRGMGQHLEQSNILTAGLHKLLTPLLGRAGGTRHDETLRTYAPEEGGG